MSTLGRDDRAAKLAVALDYGVDSSDAAQVRRLPVGSYGWEERVVTVVRHVQVAVVNGSSQLTGCALRSRFLDSPLSASFGSPPPAGRTGPGQWVASPGFCVSRVLQVMAVLVAAGLAAGQGGGQFVEGSTGFGQGGAGEAAGLLFVELR